MRYTQKRWVLETPRGNRGTVRLECEPEEVDDDTFNALIAMIDAAVEAMKRGELGKPPAPPRKDEK